MGGGRPSGARTPEGRQNESELRQRIAEAEELRRELGPRSDLGRELGNIIEQLNRLNPDALADPSQLALLKREIEDPVRQLELELNRRLQAKLGKGGAGSPGDGEAPDRYRKMIEDYYRRLSVRSAEARP
jgi:hypothetical protein